MKEKVSPILFLYFNWKTWSGIFESMKKLLHRSTLSMLFACYEIKASPCPQLVNNNWPLKKFSSDHFSHPTWEFAWLAHFIQSHSRVSASHEALNKYEVHSIRFQTFFFFVQAFKIVVDSWKFNMLLLYILWDDWPIFMISGKMNSYNSNWNTPY